LLLRIKTWLLKASGENCPEPDALQMRSSVPIVDQSPLAGSGLLHLNVMRQKSKQQKSAEGQKCALL
jgi:hypothetical protein